MRRRPPISTRTDTLFPFTTLFRSEALVGLVALEHPHRLALRPVEQCGHQRRGGVACERHELARLVVAGRHVDHRANERHRILGEVAVAGATRSAERRVGKAWVRTCRSRWSPYH